MFLTVNICVGILIVLTGSVICDSKEDVNNGETGQISDEVGQPLFLTPYIESGDIENGQKAAKVHPPFFNDMESYSGFLTVNKQYNSNLFFWFFPAEEDHSNAPLVLWLEGGPGISSLRGLLDQHGPFFVNKRGKLEKRKYYWSQNLNVIYLDNPVGAGFSYTEHVDGYSRSHIHAAENVYTAVKQFYQLFPQYLTHDFYISGSSYGCKFVSALAYIIDVKENKENILNKINLKGLIIGNGFCDPPTALQSSELLYQVGMIDMSEKFELDNNYKKTFELLNEKEPWFDNYDTGHSLILNMSGYKYQYNYLFDNFEKAFPYGNTVSFINKNSTKYKINVGNRNYSTDDDLNVFDKFKNELLTSVKPIIEYLLFKYKIIIYNGQLDIMVTFSSMMKFLESLNWPGSDIYKNAKRQKWYVDGQLAGYVTQGDKLTFVLVRNAGHDAATDKPREVQDLVLSFIQNSFK